MSRRIKRGSLLVAVGIVLTTLAVGVATVRFFVRPPVDRPVAADAVVVFGARSRAERLSTALELIGDDVADVLVLSAPPENTDCGRRAPIRILCFTPRPFTTRGEARALASLARQQGWRTIVLVTSTYHVTRAALLVRRCYDGEVEVVAAEPPTRGEIAEAIPHEWGGLVDAVVRGC